MGADTKTLTTFDGRSGHLSLGTIKLLEAMERAMGEPSHSTTLNQFGWQPVTSFSGDTHTGDAYDLTTYRELERSKTIRLLGGMYYIRPAIPGKWKRHGHGGRLGCSTASDGMKGQFAEYLSGGDGLIGDALDAWWRPRYPKIHFAVGAPRIRWIALRDTTGYDQPGGNSNDKRINRAKGFVWGKKNIATVRVRGAGGVTDSWLVTDGMTFYRRSDFAAYVPGFVARSAKFTVVKAPAYGRVLPDRDSDKITVGRPLGHIVSSVGYVEVDGRKWERTGAGSFYFGGSLELITSATPTSFTYVLGEVNLRVLRLSPVNDRNLGDWQQGAAYADRVPVIARHLRGASIVVTAESGGKAESALMDAELGAVNGADWQDRLYGDGSDISEAIAHDITQFTERAHGYVHMTPAGPGTSHNIAPWVLLEHRETGIRHGVVGLHLIPGTSNDEQRGQQAMSLVAQIEAVPDLQGVPVVYTGEVDDNDEILADSAEVAFAKSGYVDVEATPCAVENGDVDATRATGIG